MEAMSIHSLLEQSRRNLAWRTCPTETITATVTPIGSAAAAGSASVEVQRAA